MGMLFHGRARLWGRWPVRRDGILRGESVGPLRCQVGDHQKEMGPSRRSGRFPVEIFPNNWDTRLRGQVGWLALVVFSSSAVLDWLFRVDGTASPLDIALSAELESLREQRFQLRVTASCRVEL